MTLAQQSLWVWLDDPQLAEMQVIGTLAHGERGSIRFAYADAWLRLPRAFPLDPALPLSKGDFFSAGGHFGVFLDSCPDRWGQVLMQRREALLAKDEGRRARNLGLWEQLIGVQDATRMGALRFSPENSRRFLSDEGFAVPPLAQIASLQGLATELSRGDADSLPGLRHWLAALVAPGSSLGGARPKANLVDGTGCLWIAKFPAHADMVDMALWEMLYRDLAQKAGIQVAEAELWDLPGRPHTYLSKRFDRQGAFRRYFCSAMTLLKKGDGQAASYLELAEFLANQGDPATLDKDLPQLFRRVLFNVAVGNRDDHLRNHGFLRQERGWTLAPAFDMNPAFDKAEHVLAIDEVQTLPSLDTVLENAPYYRLTLSQAKLIREEVLAAIKTWKAHGRRLGLSRSELARADHLLVVG